MSERIPVLPLKDTVVFPKAITTLFVGTASSIQALEAGSAAGGQILLATKLDASVDRPSQADLFPVGTVATILQTLPLPDGTVKVLVEGERRAAIEALFDTEFIEADVAPDDSETPDAGTLEAMTRTIMDHFDRYVKSRKDVADDVIASVSSIDEPGRLIDTIASQIDLKLAQRLEVLECFALDERMQKLLLFMETEIDVQKLEKKIRGRVKKQMEKTQREYYLNEQMKAIQNELGEGEGGNELDDLAAAIESSGMPAEARAKVENELAKLKLMAPMSAEATVVRSYLDWTLKLPWKKKSRVRRDLRSAQEILDADHYGLEEVKERIVEYLAVQGRVRKLKGPVLCLVGPPGVGKTSLGESVARATNRQFVRMALGGVRDEAEIRGHRRTYIGSMPGKVLQKMAKAGVKNPLFLLDEVDKMGMDFRGDPASALLEVLDPEQNNTFNDHYVEMDFDLSDVFFICTSNSMNIPAALLDRMEVIRLPGYTEDEKLNIAERFLVPKQRKLNGLGDDDLVIEEEAIRHLIRFYTREAGVRGLEREIAKLARKVVTEQALGGEARMAITVDDIEALNGVRKFDFGRAEEENQVGIVTGLAYTQVGGEILNIEAVSVPGKGRQIKTGSLGDVMQESIQAAMTFVRSRAASLGVTQNFHEDADIHIHVPEGATPKDGPSAGIGMCTALVSVLTGIPVRAEVAMTGEITLRGQVLPIGGLKEKLLAAHRGGITKVIIPAENERNLKEVPDNIKADLEIIPVKWMDEVIEIALESLPVAHLDDEIVAEAETANENRAPATSH